MMNQDFTVQKKSNIWQKKKLRAEGFTWKKIPAQAESLCRRKKIRASWKYPTPPPHHFSNGPFLSILSFFEGARLKFVKR